MPVKSLFIVLSLMVSGCAAPRLTKPFDQLLRRPPQVSGSAGSTSLASGYTVDRTSVRGVTPLKLASSACSSGGG